MRSLLPALLLTLMTAASTQAATIGYELELSGNNRDRPEFRVTNTSTTATITSLTFFIGRTDRNFDRVFTNTLQAPLGGSITLTYGETGNGGSSLLEPLLGDLGGRYNSIAFAFGGFDTGEFAEFSAELDRDDLNTNEDYRNIFFNNGSFGNAQVSVGFSNGSFLSMALPDQVPGLTNYAFTQTQTVGGPGVVPLPASVFLLGAGLAGLGLMRRRRTPRAA